MVDAQIYALAVDRLEVLPQQLGICHIHRDDALGRKDLLRLFGQQELVAFGNGIAAQHGSTFPHLAKCLRQRIAGTDAIAVRTAVNENMGILTILQPLCGFFQGEFLQLRHSSPVSSPDSSAGKISCSFRLISALCAMESSATKCSAGHFRIFRR